MDGYGLTDMTTDTTDMSIELTSQDALLLLLSGLKQSKNRDLSKCK